MKNAFVACDVREKWEELTKWVSGIDVLILNGDLLNVFPNPPKPLEGSIVYEIAPQETKEALNDFKNYKQGYGDCEVFRSYTRNMFNYNGKYSGRVVKEVENRLENGFRLLSETKKKIFVVPGNLDIPGILSRYCDKFGFIYLDSDSEHYWCDGSFIAGVGGIPSSSNPVKGRFTVFPNEKEDKIYWDSFKRAMRISNVLVTHLNYDFLRSNPSVERIFYKRSVRTAIFGSGDRSSSYEKTVRGKRIVIPGSFEESLQGIILTI